MSNPIALVRGRYVKLSSSEMMRQFSNPVATKFAVLLEAALKVLCSARIVGRPFPALFVNIPDVFPRKEFTIAGKLEPPGGFG
jgi:hypothetical protein